jgi:hypothetical protein
MHLTLTATGAPGSTIGVKAAGTGYNDPGLQFTANVQISPGFDLDIPTKCFPMASPVLSVTAINQPGAAPATQYSPALAGSVNRTLSIATVPDGRIFHDWWDLGGAGHGWRATPGSMVSDASPGGALVKNGDYAFIIVKQTGGNVYLNQGTPGGSWVGWQFLGISSKVGPTVASSNDRTIAIITGTDGRLMYDWWDLGGGGHGWREIPGGFHSDVSAGASLVSKGTYAFVLAKGSNGNVLLNQGAPGGTWVGWQSLSITTKVAPSASSSGDRSIAVVVETDGRVMYDWWDIGGGGHGWREVPGDFRTDSAVGVGFVGNGIYAFLLAKDTNGRLWLNQGDPTTGIWVGWR